jgi:hypothetical protein
MEAKADGMSFFQLPRQDYIRTFQARAFQALKADAKATAAAGGAIDLHAASGSVVAQ